MARRGADLWLRTTFRIDAADIPRALLWGRWDDTIEVYINGALAAPVEAYTPGYRYLGLKTATLVSGGPNTLAVHATDLGGARYFDLAVALNEALTTMPMSGFERTPTLAAYSTAVRQFMREHGIPGGVLAVMKKDQVVVNRAFGWADKSFTRPMLPDAVMRLGGQEVILTAGAVVTLIDAGIEDPITRQKITRDTRVFPLLRAHGLTPLPGRTPVPEIDQVTVGMLLAFESGVSELPGDPGQLYADLGVAPGAPTTAEDNVRWVYSMPLARPLGSPAGDGYTGYMLLRHLVHVVTGDLLAFLRTAVFAPAGSSDVFIAHEPLAARNPREPGYLTLEPPYDRSIYLENCTRAGHHRGGVRALSAALPRLLGHAAHRPRDPAMGGGSRQRHARPVRRGPGELERRRAAPLRRGEHRRLLQPRRRLRRAVRATRIDHQQPARIGLGPLTGQRPIPDALS